MRVLPNDEVVSMTLDVSEYWRATADTHVPHVKTTHARFECLGLHAAVAAFIAVTRSQAGRATTHEEIGALYEQSARIPVKERFNYKARGILQTKKCMQMLGPPT